MMQPFYLTDLDKTFLRSDLTVGDFSRRIWNEAVERGVKLSVATARSYTGVKKLLQGLMLKEPLILLDGVLIASPEGKMLHVSAVDKELGEEILAIGEKEAGLLPLIVALDENDTERFIYPKRRNSCLEELLRTVHNNRRILDADPLQAMERNLKLVYLGDEATTARLEAAFRDRLENAVEIKRSKDPYIDCWFMTVLHPEGDKAHALRKLEAMEGVDAAHTTVFGDSHNDLGLFAAAGRRIAVANAIDELKAQADIVLPWSNDEEGVAKFLARELNL